MTLKLPSTCNSPIWTQNLIERAISVAGYQGKVVYDPECEEISGIWRPYANQQVEIDWWTLPQMTDRIGVYVFGPKEDGALFPFAEDTTSRNERIAKITQIKNAAIAKYNEQMRLQEICDRREVVERERQSPYGKKYYEQVWHEPNYYTCELSGDLRSLDSPTCVQQ